MKQPLHARHTGLAHLNPSRQFQFPQNQVCRAARIFPFHIQDQLLVSPTLWGWLGSRLGIRQPAESRYQGRLHLSRLLGEMRIAWESAAKVLDKLAAAVRASLSALVHNRREAWPMTQFRPGIASRSGSGSKPTVLPTEKDSGRGPPR